MKVTDPAGEVWAVKRRWLPWRLRRRDVRDALNGDLSGMSGDVGDDLIIGLAIFVGLVLIVVFVPVVLVVAILVAELLLLLLLLPAFVVLRAGYVARWPIEVWRGDDLVHADAVRGWSASHGRMLAIADELRRGEPSSPARRAGHDGGNT